MSREGKFGQLDVENIRRVPTEDFPSSINPQVTK